VTADWLSLLWFLLPVAAFSGWLAARRAPRNPPPGPTAVNPEYMKGLNYVLNEQPDKAIEVFIKMVEVDSETVETHLALGNLFRRRGEVDRAIRIHQNLMARPGLSVDQKGAAMLELGLDYMRSGLLDRAEVLLEELAGTGAFSTQAHRHLLEIYQQERDWPNAIRMARLLEDKSGERLNPTVAHFHCELASGAVAAGALDDAHRHLERALSTDPRCVRASLLEAELARRAGQPRDAIKAYKRVESQDAEFLPDIVAPLADCYRELGRIDEFMAHLRVIVDTHGGITPLLLLTDLIAEHQGEDAALKFVSGELRRRPTIRGVSRLVDYALRRADGEVRDDLQTIRELILRLQENRPVYRCHQCGFNASMLHWQCPGCRTWNSVKPVHGVEGE
jgi:lipopolysaccharide biosynthesis regulator YciM